MSTLIWTSPHRRCGAPCIKGTRIDVGTIVRCLDRWSIAEILRQYPDLNRKQVWAAIFYYARNSRNPRTKWSFK